MTPSSASLKHMTGHRLRLSFAGRFWTDTLPSPAPPISNPDHIAENCDIFEFLLTETERDEIRSLDPQERYENW